MYALPEMALQSTPKGTGMQHPALPTAVAFAQSILVWVQRTNSALQDLLDCLHHHVGHMHHHVGHMHQHVGHMHITWATYTITWAYYLEH